MIKKYIIFECYRKAEHFINLLEFLSIFNESKEKDMLQGLTSFSLERTFKDLVKNFSQDIFLHISIVDEFYLPSSQNSIR